MSTVNLLHIEDNEEIADIIKGYLQLSKYTDFNITHKGTLSEGIEYLDKMCENSCSCEIDIILLDLVLPNSSGVNTFKMIKKKCDFIPIVIISGYEDMAYECVKLGAQDYLTKLELSVDLLERSIRHSIERVRIENEFKNVIRTSSLGYHMYELRDNELIFCGYNPAASKILGVDNHQFLNKEIMEAFPNLPPVIPKMYRRTIQEGIPWTNQVIEYEDNNINNAFYRLNAYKTAENHLTVTFEDITKQVNIGEDLKRNQAKYKRLVEVTRAGMFELDLITERLVYVNDVMCNQLGWSKEELLNMKPSDFMHKDSLPEMKKRITTLRNGKPVKIPHEYKGNKKDGSVFWGLVTSEFVCDEDGNAVTANGVIIDITSQKLAEEALKKKEEEVFITLENKIYEWKEELVIRNINNEKKLEMIDGEILSITGVNEV